MTDFPVFRADLPDPGLWDAVEGLVQASGRPGRRTSRRPRQIGKKQVQCHLPVAEVEQLIAKYLAGATTLELAEAYGIRRTTALALLERNQVPRRGRFWAPNFTEHAIQL